MDDLFDWPQALYYYPISKTVGLLPDAEGKHILYKPVNSEEDEANESE